MTAQKTARAGIRASLLKRAYADAAIVAVAAVMAFGQAEFLISRIRFGAAAYEPFPMTYMIYPTWIAAFMVSAARMAAILGRLDGRRARGTARMKNGALRETGLTAAVSAASGGLIEFFAYERTAPAGLPALLSILAAALSTGAVVGAVSFLRFKAAWRRALESIAAARKSRRTGARFKPGGSGSGALGSVAALRRSRLVESMVIVVGSVMTFGLVEFTANVVVSPNPDYRPIDMIGMILPMAAVMGAISFASLKVVSRALLQLVSGIERVASGDFDAELDPAHAGPYREVFDNFNAMTRELRSVRTLREDFINHFSHEFKTPIASINGFARILLEEDLPGDERKRYLGIIAAESARLAEMAGNALAMASLDSQEFLAPAAPFALDEELRQCAILLAPQWTAKGIDLTADLEPTTIRGDAGLLRRVWINILGNAVKFTPPGGAVTVELRRRGAWAETTISDTGPGMSAEELSRAFEKYYQGAAGRAAKGLGLGLSIAARIVRLGGGELTARSERGAGSAFTVRLPL